MPRIDPDVARIGAALADPSRVAMLDALMDGKAHAIGALARHAGITAATASGHPRERVQHLAGRLGAALAELCLAERWVVRVRDSRALRVTDRGRSALGRELGVVLPR